MYCAFPITATLSDNSSLCAGKLCIEVSPNSKMAWISEELCIGCGICVKVVLDIHVVAKGFQPLLLRVAKEQ